MGIMVMDQGFLDKLVEETRGTDFGPRMEEMNKEIGEKRAALREAEARMRTLYREWRETEGRVTDDEDNDDFEWRNPTSDMPSVFHLLYADAGERPSLFFQSSAPRVGFGNNRGHETVGRVAAMNMADIDDIVLDGNGVDDEDPSGGRKRRRSNTARSMLMTRARRDRDDTLKRRRLLAFFEGVLDGSPTLGRRCLFCLEPPEDGCKCSCVNCGNSDRRKCKKSPKKCECFAVNHGLFVMIRAIVVKEKQTLAAWSRQVALSVSRPQDVWTYIYNAYQFQNYRPKSLYSATKDKPESCALCRVGLGKRTIADKPMCAACTEVLTKRISEKK